MNSDPNSHLVITQDWSRELELATRDCVSALLLVSAGAVNRGTLATAMKAMSGINLEVISDVPPNPTMRYLDTLVARFAQSHPDVIVAVGGGSVIDVAKVASVSRGLVNEFLSLSNYFSTSNKKIRSSATRVVAIPTTAGTGAEVTQFATIWDEQFHRKVSLDQYSILPDVAIIDPNLMATASRQLLLYPALDTASHLLESLWSKRRTSHSMMHAICGMEASIGGLTTLQDATITPGYSQLTLASLLGGMAINESRTALAHSISYPLTLAFGVPHGLACSFTLPAIWDHARESFPASMERDKIDTMIETLLGFNLGEMLLNYATCKNVLSELPYMLNVDRSNNYIRPVSGDDIKRFIQVSML